MIRTRVTACLIVASAALASAVPALAQEDFYKGKTINIVVGYSPGGGYDLYARLLARHFGRHIPGNPSVIVQNMPGAATMTSVRYLDTTAPKDGTVINAFDPGQILETFASPEVFKMKFSDYQWVGALLRDVRICYAWAATGVKNFDDMMHRKEFLIGTTSKGSNAYVNGAILRKVFDAPIRQIAGYPGSNEQRLALERGELEGNCASWSAMPQDWIVNHKFNALTRFSPKRPPDMPESIPYVVDLAKTQDQKDLIEILDASTEVGRPYIVSKQVPADRVRILRSAFDAVLKDDAFLAEAQKLNMPLDPMSGEEAEKIMNTIYSAPPEMAKKVKDVLE